MISLVLGGARSGKSRYAEQLAQGSGRQVIYVATAQALDQEMAERISHHQNQRPSEWLLIESPLALAGTIRQYSDTDYCLIIDCLTLWLSNQLLKSPERLLDEIGGLVDAAAAATCQLILVSNEVGMAIVPENALARRFRDEAGRLNQKFAEIADQVTLIVAGLPLPVKGGVR